MFVLALAYVLTLAAALAPLRALDDVAIRVFTLVFVNVCDSLDESDAAALPADALAPPLAPPFAPRVMPFTVLLLCSFFLESVLYKKNCENYY